MQLFRAKRIGKDDLRKSETVIEKIMELYTVEYEADFIDEDFD